MKQVGAGVGCSGVTEDLAEGASTSAETCLMFENAEFVEKEEVVDFPRN
jgi:hypothetical protein